MRLMTQTDLDTVIKIQCEAYAPFFHEAKKAFADKLRMFSAGCWIAGRNGKDAGYIFSHPWCLEEPPELDAELIELPSKVDCYYIHDLAVDPRFEGCGVGRELADKAIALFEEHEDKFGYEKMLLVAAQSSEPFWARFGFEALRDLTPLMRVKIESYGPDACFMVRAI